MNIFQRIFIYGCLITACLVGMFNITAGVTADTVIQTQDGPRLLKTLMIGDKILCLSLKDLSIEERSILFIREREITDTIKITAINNITLHVTPDQKLFVNNRWVEAEKLTLEDVLATKDQTTFIKIIGISHVHTPITVYDITVDEHHNFFAGENSVLLHNFVFALPLLAWGAGAGITFFEGITLAGIASAIAGVIMRESIAQGIKKTTGKDISGSMGATNVVHGGTDNPERENNSNDCLIFAVKAPGIPTADDGYIPPKRGNGQKVRSENGRGWGYLDQDGKIWIPSGEDGHGGPHWDVQPAGGKGPHENIVPGGGVRGDN